MIDRRSLADRWHRLDVTVRDAPLALVLLVASIDPGLRDHGTQVGDMPARPFDGFTVLVLLLECLPLVVRRRLPGVCLALVSVGFVIDQLLGYHTVGGTALPIALLSAGAWLERRRLTAVVLSSAAYVALAVALVQLGALETVSDFVAFYLVVALAWGAGAWLRRTRAVEEERRVLVAETTRTAERTRIARELHDVVTHHVTAMVVQAEAARYLTGAPDRLEEGLTSISETGRGAISDLRHLLDVLDPDHHAAARGPVVGDITALVEQTRRAGQRVELVEEGTATATVGGAELAAYRVVQEALTNALKHAYGARTTVHVLRGATETTVEVGTDGSGRPALASSASSASADGSGRGLAGLRERVGLLGGELSARRGTDGGFVVRARIPAGSVS